MSAPSTNIRSTSWPLPLHKRLGFRFGLIVFLILIVADFLLFPLWGKIFMLSYPEWSDPESLRRYADAIESGACCESFWSITTSHAWMWRAPMIIALVVLIGLYAILLAFLVSWLATRRIRRLARQVRATTAKGTVPGSFEASGGDEIDVLAATMNEMQLRLAERDSLRTEWVGAVSHDLRTPLTALSASADQCHRLLPSIESASLRHQLGKLLTSIQLEVGRVSDLAEDLLEIARLELKEELIREPVPAGELLFDVHQELRPLAENRGLSLEVVIPKGLPLLRADGRRLMRAIENLVANSLKHAHSRARLSAQVRADLLEIRVEDDGPGFSVDAKGKVTAETLSKSARNSPSGIGLEVAGGIVAAHGGELRVENATDGGAVAHILLPITSARGTSDSEPQS